MTVVLDGAMGTELARRGFPLCAPRWSAAALDDAEGLVAAIHRDFVVSGAQILTTNTFALAHADPRQAALAIALARRAIDVASDRVPDARRVRIAGSIGALGRRGDPVASDDGPGWRDLGRRYAAMARALVDAGADLVLVETLIDARDAEIAVEAIAAQGLGCPLWVTVAFGPGAAWLGHGDPAALPTAGVDAWLVGCTEGDALADALAVLPPATAGWRGVAPNTGRTQAARFVPDAADDDTLRRVVDDVRRAHALQVVGGCCGTTAAWLAQVARDAHPTLPARAAGFDALDRHLEGRP